MVQDRQTAATNDSWFRREAVLLQFEAAWRDQEAPVIEEFLADGVDCSDKTLVELCKIDLEHHLRRGNRLAAGDYANRFPQLEQQPLFDELSAFSTEISERLNGRVQLPQAGEKIRHYVLDSQIGEGAFAVVFAAWDTVLQRAVAVKVLRPAKVDRHAVLQRMRREALAIASLRHENVVPVYDAGSFGGLEFIVTRLVEGETLEQSLGSQAYSPRESAEVVRRLADAMDDVHRQGIVHRDIKPSNIMMDGDNPLIFDFGLAHVTDASLQLTQEGDLLGTPAYMSPEQASGQGWHVDRRSDIYSLGALLFHLTCHRLPFEGTIAEVVHQVIERECPDPAKINHNVDRDMSTIIRKCLSKQPEDRYQTASSLADDLQRLLLHEPIMARPLGPVARVIRWSRRRPVVAGLIATSVILIAFVVGTATQLMQVQRQRDRATTAESTTHKLLASASIAAGNLAFQRGQFADAKQHFERGLERDSEDRQATLLQLARAALASRDVPSAVKYLNQVIDLQGPAADADESSDTIQLLKAEIALRDPFHYGTPLDLLGRLDPQRLTPANAAFHSALLSDSSPAAITVLGHVCEADPHHFAARKMLALTLFSLARFEEALAELTIARQFFDDDEDFRLLESLVLTALGDQSRGHELIRSTTLNDGQQEQWLELSEFVYHFTHVLRIDRGLADLNAPALRALSDRFVAEFAPLLTEGDWHLPPKIAEHFERLPGELALIVEAPSSAVSDYLRQLTQIHPEGSLSLLLGATYLAQVPFENGDAAGEIATLEQAREAFRRAAEQNVFVNESSSYGHLGDFATSVALAHSYRHDEAANRQAALKALGQMEPKMIVDQMRLRTICITFLTAIPNSAAPSPLIKQLVPWIDQWCQVTQLGSASHRDALWHRAMMHTFANDWQSVLTTCDAMIEQSPDDDSAKALRRKAVRKLGELIDAGNGVVDQP